MIPLLLALALMADPKPDLSYIPPSAAELRAEALRRSVAEAAEPKSKWFTPLSPAEIALQAAFLGFGGADWGQTINFTQHSRMRETNPVLGGRPSRAKVNILIPLGLAAHTLGVYALPRPWRNLLQVGGLAGEVEAVTGNYRAGVKPIWPWK